MEKTEEKKAGVAYKEYNIPNEISDEELEKEIEARQIERRLQSKEDKAEKGRSKRKFIDLMQFANQE